MWRKLAEIAGQYLKKGSAVYIEGKITTRTWDKDGVKHYKTEIVADSMQMLGGKDSGKPIEKPQANPMAKNDVNFDFDEEIGF